MCLRRSSDSLDALGTPLSASHPSGFKPAPHRQEGSRDPVNRAAADQLSVEARRARSDARILETRTGIPHDHRETGRGPGYPQPSLSNPLRSAVDTATIQTTGRIAIVPHAFYLDYEGRIDTLLIVGDLRCGTVAIRRNYWRGFATERPPRDGSAPSARAYSHGQKPVYSTGNESPRIGFSSSGVREYPVVTVDPEPIFIRDARLSMTAGATAGLDLALGTCAAASDAIDVSGTTRLDHREPARVFDTGKPRCMAVK